MVDCLRQLGVTINANSEEETLTVVGLGQAFDIPSASLFVGNSGTTARFITPAIAAGKGVVTLDGVARMRERPMQDLIDAVTQLGGNVTSINGTGCPPLAIQANGLRGGHTNIRANISSQFLSGLLLASPYADQESIIEIDGTLLSAPYVRMTIDMMADFGVDVFQNNGVAVALGQMFDADHAAPPVARRRFGSMRRSSSSSNCIRIHETRK
jgi:3-phosphoshikimate 1-carboxyvinyltransferase